MLAISLEPNTTIFQKTLALNDFYFGMEGFEYPMGNIQMLGKSSGTMYRGEKPLETALLPTGLLDNLADHAVDFWLTTEDLPHPQSRVTLDDDGNVVVWNPKNADVLSRLTGHENRVLSIAFSADGKRIYYNVNAGDCTELHVAEAAA